MSLKSIDKEKIKRIKRIGIFGGSFDPVHIAHVHFATEFIEKIDLDYLYIVPAFISPFKTEEISRITSPELRLAMLNLAFGKNKKIRISKYEINKKNVSYSYLTIKYYQRRYPKSELFLMIGSDQALEFKRWKNWEFILEKTRLVIAERNEIDKKYDKEKINNELSFNQKHPIWLAPYKHHLSSTEIRELIRENKEWKHLVPSEVYDFILKEALYK